jgi:isopenicillin-N N-acyltransferase-like protein
MLNSRLRLYRLENLLKHENMITVESVKKILSDHSNFPKSICKHVKKGVNDEVSTIGSVIINITDKTLYFTSGNPCENVYMKRTLR